MKKWISRWRLQYKIFSFFMLFIGILIFILGLFQVLFIDEFYQYVKQQQTISVTHTISNNLSNENLAESLDSLSDNSDYCVRILSLDNLKEIYVNAQNSAICGYMVSTSKEIAELYTEALENDGSAVLIAESEAFPGIENAFSSTSSNGVSRAITCVEIGYINDNEYLIIVSSKISVLDEIKTTLSTQLLIISMTLIFISSIIAYFLTRHIASPISKINTSAKQLALGNFDTNFEGTGYLEIEELNDTLNYAKNNLGRVEKLRNEFIANMSHDLRTPLTMISGYAELMRDIPGENKTENIQVIIDECKRLNELINDSLTLTKLQTNNEPLQLSEFNLTITIQEIVSRINILLHDDSYDITFDFTDEVMIEADIVKINQVVYNLLLNAIHYSEKNKKIRIIQTIKENKVCIEIIDSGRGIKPEDIDKVFNRYYQSRNRNNKGSGLGLSIVKSVLELHHANYGVNSVVEEGSTFYFELEIIDKKA